MLEYIFTIGNIFAMITMILGIWGWLKKDNTSKWLTTVAVIGIFLVGAYDIYDRIASGQEMTRLEQMAEPPSLTLLDYTVHRGDGGFSTIIRLRKSKNESLGIIQLRAMLPQENTSTITDFWPDGYGITSTGKDSKKISSDGKLAMLTYQSALTDSVQIKLTTSDKTSVILQGNYIKDPIALDIK